ncbi:MAG: DUF885 domain-containing protein [Xanthomonadales bacterium]|nr:DUF885 domain-containing protein [Xanthomonadales bacterium]
MKKRYFVPICALFFCMHAAADSHFDEEWKALAANFVNEMPALSPVGATQLGDHRFDGQLDDISALARADRAAFIRRYQEAMAAIDRSRLSRANQVDYALLAHELESSLWSLEELQSWAWNPLNYTRLAGSAIYALMAREFAPLPERLVHVTARLEQLPRFYEQVRETLEPERVPQVHAETAIRQNKGVLSILENQVKPALSALDERQQARLVAAMEAATAAVETQQDWLESTLLPLAKADFRVGEGIFDTRLAFALNTPLTRDELRERAEAELHRVRDEMFEVAKVIYSEKYPMARFPEEPDEAYKQVIIRAGLEVAYEDLPPRDGIVATAKAQIEQATRFVREHDLVEVPDDPVEVIIMPEFARGFSIAYCDSPGPLDTGQKTFYAISPMPEDWTDQQVESFLREYNVWSMQDLTVHEAMPGHYLQLAHSGRYPSTLRAVLQSGTFIEGWAVYAEQLMVNAGYNDNDPRQKLIALKWLLRSVTNALMDQAIHVDGMTREEAMELMVEGGFQEEREAALKWVRAQLSFTQLSTYMVGYLEHIDLQAEVREAWGDAYTPRKYHDALLSFGSPPVRFARALLLDSPIPE